MISPNSRNALPWLEIIPAVSPAQISEVRDLFKEYAASIGISLCFQNFREELANLPGEYATPSGALFLAELAGKAVGCIAVRGINRTCCEMKRLYVRPECRGKQIGRALVERIINEARHVGYEMMVLDTLRSMECAIKLYESIGFKKTKPYYPNPHDGVVCLRLALTSSLPQSTRGRILKRDAGE